MRPVGAGRGLEAVGHLGHVEHESELIATAYDDAVGQAVTSGWDGNADAEPDMPQAAPFANDTPTGASENSEVLGDLWATDATPSDGTTSASRPIHLRCQATDAA